MKRPVLVGFGFWLLLATQAAATPLPWAMSYQGKLLDANGIPLNGAYSGVVFSIYDVAAGGAPLWTETQDITAVDGFFSVQLGAVAPLSEAVFLAPGAAGGLYLGIQVPPDAGELSPRQQLGMAPYSAAASTLMNDMGVQLISNVVYATFTAAGNFQPRAGIVAGSGSFSQGVTAASGTFLSVGDAQYSVEASSGIRIPVGTLRLQPTSRGLDASGTGMVASTGAFAVLSATGTGGFSITTSSGISMALGTLRLGAASRGLDASGLRVEAGTGTFAVATATGTNDFSLRTSSGIRILGGAFEVDGPALFANISSFTARGSGVFSITSSSGIQVNGGGMFLAGAFQGDGSLLSNVTVLLSSSVAVIASRTWPKPSNVRRVLVQVIGGGGGGGGAAGAAVNSSMGSGGGGGGCAFAVVDLQNVSSVVVTVSTGATGAAAGANNGTHAAPTSFGAYAVAAGGVGGIGMAAGTTFLLNTGGAGGSGTTGDLLMTGSQGGLAMRLSGTQGKSGFGGASACSGGKRTNPPGAANGNAGRTYGGGGSGALTLSNVQRTGGAGAAGAVLIWAFN